MRSSKSFFWTLPLLTILLIPITFTKAKLQSSPTEASVQALVAGYAEFHRSHRHKGQAPRLVYRYDSRQPGLGDRILGLLTAYTMAAFSKRVLLVDWIRPNDIFNYFKPLSIPNLKFLAVDHDKSEFRCDTAECKRSGLYPLLSKKETVVYSKGMPLANIGDVRMFIARHPNLELSGKLGSAPQLPIDVDLYHDIFTSLLKPAPPLQELLNKHSKLLERPFLAIHARLGLGVGEQGPRFPNLSHSALAQCIIRTADLEGRALGLHLFYLATDTPGFRAVFEKTVARMLPGARMLRIPNVGFEPVHTKICDRAPSQCLQTFFEFMVLSRATAIVATKSSFSRAARLVGGVRHFRLLSSQDCEK